MWPISCVSVGRMLFVPVSYTFTPLRKISKEKIKTSLSVENAGVQIPKEYSSLGSKNYIIFRYILAYKPGFESSDKTTATVSQMVETKTKQLHWPNGINPGVFQYPVPCCSHDGLKTSEFSTHKTLSRNYSTNQFNESMPDQDKYPKGFPRLRSPVNSYTNYMATVRQREPWKNDIQRKAEPLTPDNRWKQEE